MNVSLVVNPIAGNRAYKLISKITSLLENRVSLTSCITREKGDAFNFAQKVKDTDLIIIGSGDGTINEVLNGLLNSSDPRSANIPLALIPLGTTNVLAKDLNIPENLEKAVELALTGKAKKVALGKINGKYFSLMAGIGLDAMAVLGVKNGLLKQISGKAEHVVSGIKALRDYDPPLIKVKTPELEMTGYTVVVGNAKNYGGYFYVTPNASITEPLLDICIFSGKSRMDMLRFVGGVIQKKHLNFKDVTYAKSETVEISSEGEVHVQIDGDYFGTLPVNIDVVKDAVSIVY